MRAREGDERRGRRARRLRRCARRGQRRPRDARQLEDARRSTAHHDPDHPHPGRRADRRRVHGRRTYLDLGSDTLAVSELVARDLSNRDLSASMLGLVDLRREQLERAREAEIVLPFVVTGKSDQLAGWISAITAQRADVAKFRAAATPSARAAFEKVRAHAAAGRPHARGRRDTLPTAFPEGRDVARLLLLGVAGQRGVSRIRRRHGAEGDRHQGCRTRVGRAERGPLVRPRRQRPGAARPDPHLDHDPFGEPVAAHADRGGAGRRGEPAAAPGRHARPRR